MKKILALFLFILCLFSLSVYAFAAETTVRVGANEKYTTLDAGIKALGGNGGTVVITDTVTVSTSLTIAEQSGNLTIVAEGDGRLNYTAPTLTLAKNTNANVVTLNVPVTTASSGLLILGGFNSVTFGKSFAVNGKINFYGGVNAEKGASTSTIKDAEANEKNNIAAITTLPYTITVENGNFGTFTAGNRRPARECIYGSIAAKVDVLINGGTFGDPVSYGVNDAIKTDRIFSLSGMSILADDATLTINGGTFNTPIYANAFMGTNYTTASACSQVTNSSRDYFATDGDITITINGGTFTNNCIEISALQTAASFNRLVRGNFTVTVGEGASISDGTVIDATQVKTYAGVTNKTATLNYANSAKITAKNFDSVTGCENTVAEPTRIACIGDSITQGTCSSNFNTLSYPAQLYTKLVAEGENVIVSNYGCGGTKVTDFQGMYYRDGLAYTISVNETDADIVIIGLGINDRGVVGNTVAPRDLFKAEYESLLTSYTDNPSTERVYATTATYCPEYANEISQIVRLFQKQTVNKMASDGNGKVQIVDLFELLLEDFIGGIGISSDNLHPNDSGYTAYMNAIYNAIFAEEKVTGKPLAKSADIYVDQAKGTVFGKGTKDDPIKHLTLAYEMADRNADVVTVHIVGTYTDNNIDYTVDNYSGFPSNNTPIDLNKIRYVGETDANGNNGKLLLSSKYFLMNCDTEFDNITVKYVKNSVLYYFGGFNNVKFGEGFNSESHRYAVFAAGHSVFSLLGDENDVRFSTPESVSSDKDINVEILGGKFLYVIAGNRHHHNAIYSDNAPYGTYSGNMTFTVGKNAFISNDSDNENAISGMNYLTGTITANINSWGEGIDIREYGAITHKSALAAEYDETNNTGKVIINLGEGVTNTVIRSGDMNKDGKVDFTDAMELLKCAVNDTAIDSRYLYDRSEVSLVHVIRAIRMCAK